MSYKEKIAKIRTLRTSLNRILEVANDEPQLPLDQRRMIVTSIYMGGRSGCSKNGRLVQEWTKRSHRWTQNGLTRAFGEKLNNSSYPDLPDAIMKIASLSSWAYANPNQCGDFMDEFFIHMAPEDLSDNLTLPAGEVVLSAIHSKWGGEKTIDFVELSPELFEKKYNQR